MITPTGAELIGVDGIGVDGVQSHFGIILLGYHQPEKLHTKQLPHHPGKIKNDSALIAKGTRKLNAKLANPETLQATFYFNTPKNQTIKQ